MPVFENVIVVKELKPNPLNFTKDQQYRYYYGNL